MMHRARHCPPFTSHGASIRQPLGAALCRRARGPAAGAALSRPSHSSGRVCVWVGGTGSRVGGESHAVAARALLVRRGQRRVQAIESPWSQLTSEWRRCWHPPRLNRYDEATDAFKEPRIWEDAPPRASPLFQLSYEVNTSPDNATEDDDAGQQESVNVTVYEGDVAIGIGEQLARHYGVEPKVSRRACMSRVRVKIMGSITIRAG
jgi:hypothetical protein